MEKLIIHGGEKLKGEIQILAAKNSVLPILACCILSGEKIELNNCPNISDVKGMLDIITNIGGVVSVDENVVQVDCSMANPQLLTPDLTGKIRSSIFVLGPILSRFRYAQVGYPGGCEIGLRPIDLHISGLKALGVTVEERDGLIICDGANMRGSVVDLDFPSVGATENIMMAGVLARGETVVRNAAREPEIVDLAGFINAIGGSVSGAGSSTITVRGVKKLHGTRYTPIGDRIATGTYMTAVAICGGELMVKGADTESLYPVLTKLSACGCNIREIDGAITISSSGKIRPLHRLETHPHPGFPTDMQPQLTALLTVASGASFVVENMFENRFKYTAELVKMGARIHVKDRVAMIKGVKELRPTNLSAEDLRGGAALIIAGLRANGISVISGIHHVDRGYYKIEKTLSALGAKISRINV